MVKGAHETSVNVKVGIDLDRSDTQAKAFQQHASAGSNNTFANARNDTSRDNDILGHAVKSASR